MCGVLEVWSSHVLDKQTGDSCVIGLGRGPGGVDELRDPSGLAIDGEYCFVADTYNQSLRFSTGATGRSCDATARRVMLRNLMMNTGRNY